MSSPCSTLRLSFQSYNTIQVLDCGQILALIDLVHMYIIHDLLAPAYITASGCLQVSGYRHRAPNEATRWTMMQECGRVGTSERISGSFLVEVWSSDSLLEIECAFLAHENRSVLHQYCWNIEDMGGCGEIKSSAWLNLGFMRVFLLKYHSVTL